MYAEILVELPARRTDRIFTYLVPGAMRSQIRVGSKVEVSFGQRIISGYVINLTGEKGCQDVKEIIKIIDPGPLFNENQLSIARWMSAYYLCTTVSALKAMIFPRISSGKPGRNRGLWADLENKNVPDFNRAPGQAAVWKTVLATPGLTRGQLARAAGTSPAVVDVMAAKGLICYRENSCGHRAEPLPYDKTDEPLLTDEQSRACHEIEKALTDRRFAAFVLHGVTGSGKTEVYMQCIRRALELQRQAIMLLPEISLTTQMINLFRRRFGDNMAVFHSRLSKGQRLIEYNRILGNSAALVLGTRSAVLAPVTNPGLIIIDEEHEPSYKQDDNPKYHARDTAIRLARINNAAVILGSATPSLESFARALPGGPYKMINLHKRVEERPLPRVHTVDMRAELAEGHTGFFSRKLIAEMDRRLNSGEQIILFLNRRGYSTYVACRRCGMVLKCPHCDISLTYHNDGRLRCHYCSYNMKLTDRCGGCRSEHIGLMGAGTQRVESEAGSLFPGARMIRMDADTTGRKDSHKTLLRAFGDGEADILIGTQMVAKGLDFSRVTLVGVINADTTLYMPDFRAAERTFQLLTQVAGRAGRGDREGDVVIQTYTPEHFAIQAAGKQDYRLFFDKEIDHRRILGYPPFSKLARILVAGTDEEDVRHTCVMMEQRLKSATTGYEDITIMGPAPSPLAKVKDRHRWQFMLKASKPADLRGIISRAIIDATGYKRNRVSIGIDIDPYSMM